MNSFYTFTYALQSHLEIQPETTDEEKNVVVCFMLGHTSTISAV